MINKEALPPVGPEEDRGAASLRAQAAHAVGSNLGNRAELLKIPLAHLEIYLMKHFLDAEQCGLLIGLIDADRQPSGLLAQNPEQDFRTSESCNLNPHHPVVGQVENKITALTGIEPRMGETIQGQRYAAGQQFKPHHDFFHTDQPYWAKQRDAGGQRTWTLMVFLNDPLEGGETNFPDAQIAITPRRGALLMWNNLDVQGWPNPMSLHQGMPVRAGLKYVITKWYRERPWGSSCPRI